MAISKEQLKAAIKEKISSKILEHMQSLPNEKLVPFADHPDVPESIRNGIYDIVSKREIAPEAPKQQLSSEEVLAQDKMATQAAEAGYGSGVKDVWRGTKQLLAKGEDYINPGTYDAYTKQANAERNEEYSAAKKSLGDVNESSRAQFDRFYDANRSGGSMLASSIATAPLAAVSVPTIAGTGLIAKAANIASQIGTNAALGGAANAMNFAEPGTTKGEQFAQGAAWGGGLTMAAQAAPTVIGAVAKAPKIAKGLINPDAFELADPAAREISDLGKKYNVRLHADDISQSPTVKRLGNYSSSTLFGESGEKVKQLQEAHNAVSGWLDELSSKVDDGEILDTVQSSLKRTDETTRAKAKALYDRFGEIDANTADGMPFRANPALSKYYADRGLDNPLISVASGQPVYKASQLHQVRSDMMANARRMERGLASGTTEEGALLKGEAERINNAIEAHAAKIKGTNPDLYNAWREAQDYYRDTRVPFKTSGVVRGILKSEQADNRLANAIPKNANKGRLSSERLFASMDEKGRDAFRSMLAQDAANEATKDGMFIPTRFAEAMGKRQQAFNVFFKGEQGAQAKGLAKLMQSLETSSNVQKRLMSGNLGDARITWNNIKQVGGIVGTKLAGAAVNYKTLGTPTVSAFVLRGLLNTERGKFLLTSAARLPKGHPALATMASSIASFADDVASSPELSKKASDAFEGYASDTKTFGNGAFQNGIPEPVGRNKYEHHPRLVPEPDINAVKKAFNTSRLEQPTKPIPESNIVDSTFTEVQQKRLGSPKGEIPKPGQETGAAQWDINGKRVQGQGTADYEWMKRNKPMKNWPPTDEARPKSATQHPGSEDFENTQPVEVRLSDEGKMSLISPIPDRPGKWKVDVVDDASKTSYGRMKKDGSIGEPGEDSTVYHSRGEAVRAAHQNGFKKRFDDFKKAVKAQEVLSKRSSAAQKPAKQVAKSASWVIRNKSTGEVIMETFDPKKVKALNTSKYEAVPIKEHLASLSKK